MREFKERKKPSQSSDAFFKPTVQTKLSVGQAGDQYEREADAMANRVVNGSDSTSAPKGSGGDGKPLSAGISSVQMKEIAPPKEEEKAVQKKDEDQEPVQKKEEEQESTVQKKEEEEKPVQKKGADGGVSHSVESKLSKRKGKGNILQEGVKSEMESGFGSDFSNVRIHSDSEASEMTSEMGAQAFTHGNDIYFNQGKFDPGSKAGKELLAHELTHTIQQGEMSGKNIQKKEPTNKQHARGRSEIPIMGGDFSHQLSGTFMTNNGSPSELIIRSHDHRRSRSGCNAFNVSIDGVNKGLINSNLKGETPNPPHRIDIRDLPPGTHTLSLTMDPVCSGTIHVSVMAR